MTHNNRFTELWNIIIKNVSFYDKIVADIGCGEGDFIKAVYNAGARQVDGFDLDTDNVLKQFVDDFPHAENLELKLLYNRVYLEKVNINKWKQDTSSFDILACFSTLSYLDNPQQIVKFFKTLADTVLIEMQYIGDGDGKLIEHDAEMYCWLVECGFDFVLPMGKTHVVETQKERTVWLCR